MWTDLNQMAVIPVLLIALAGWLILRGDDERAARRFLLFLLGVGVVLLLLVFLIAPGYDEPYRQFSFELPMVLMPALIGILVLVLLNMRSMKGMNLRARSAAILSILAIVVLLGLLWNSRLGVPYMVLPGTLILALTWSLGWRYGWVPEALGLTALGTLLIFSRTMGQTPLSMWFSIPLGILYFLSPILLVVVPALFITQDLQQHYRGEQAGSKRLSPGRLVFRSVLAVVMVTSLIYATFWGGAWDQTVDLGFGFILASLGGVSAIIAGLLMSPILSGKYRLVGVLYLVLMPTVLYRAYDTGTSISHHELTEKRAEQIAQAIQQFHAREGYYPENLQALTPRDLLYIPRPIILMGENWCYQGTRGFYRLSAIYREYWSGPISLRIYASAGALPEGTWACEQRLAELKPRYDPPPFAGIPETAPTPVPLPTSVTTVERKTIQPIVQARTISVGTWSPDGMVLVFGLPEVSGDQSVMGLAFLRADTGEVCPVGDRQWATGWDDGLREHFAWLPDGRLLYVPSSGDMTLFRPCEADSADLTGSYPVTFTHVLDYHAASGRILLKNQDSFWILDGTSLEAIQIPGVTPNPFEFHWDNFAWSPDGSRLAIARLNGQTAKDGSTLFIVDAETGRVETEFPLETASDQSAPMVEWMTEEELLLHGGGSLLILDFRTNPPTRTDVLRDIFLLDISYPNDISSFAWEGRHLSVRVNHPRNQGIYVFHPETGQVEIIQPKEASPLFFFPNGEMVEMANYVSDPPAEDAYELIWVDTPNVAPQFITVQGHQPRNYPNLFPRYRPETSQLAFASSQGVSLVSIPDGETLGFWELAGGDGFSTNVLPPPSYEALVAVADGVGLYYIPLP